MPKTKLNYLKAMWSSQTNLYSFLSAAAIGVGLSFPYGVLGIVPFVIYAAGSAVASLYVPSMPAFREKVDVETRQQARMETRVALSSAISAKQGQEGYDAGSNQAFSQMSSRVNALYSLSKTNKTTLSFSEVEKIDDALNEYLHLWLTSVLIAGRAKAVKLKEVNAKIEKIDTALVDKVSSQQLDSRQLIKAKQEYEALITRHQKMQSQKVAIDALLTTMPDQIEEIYQAVIAAPNTMHITGDLSDAIAKLGLDDAVEEELDLEVSNLVI